MHAVEAPRPLHGAGAEHERRVRALRVHGVLPVQRERVRRGARAHVSAVVGNLLRNVDDRRRQPQEAARPRSFVPFVAERVRCQRGRRAGRQRIESGVAPESERAHFGGNGDRVRAAVDRPDRAGQCVFRPAAVGRRAEARVAPRPGPLRRRIDLRVVERFLVADERSTRRDAVEAWLPARLPEHLVAAEEREVDAGVARRFDVRALIRRPVLVVADREVNPVPLDQRRAGVGIDAGEVAHVVAVGFEPAEHRVFGVEQPALGIVIACIERAVVADLHAAGRAAVIAAGVGLRPAAVEAHAAKAVVRLPCRIGGLEQQVRRARIVAHDERDVARAGAYAVGARQLREVDARRLAARIPRGRHRPVRAVDEARRRVRQAIGLRLRLREVGCHDLPGTGTSVVAKSVDVHAEAGCVRLDLELDRLSGIDADAVGESLNRQVIGGREVQVGCAGQTVLGDDRVGRRVARQQYCCDLRRRAQQLHRGPEDDNVENAEDGRPDNSRTARTSHIPLLRRVPRYADGSENPGGRNSARTRGAYKGDRCV